MTTTSSVRNRGLRLADMLTTVWTKRRSYKVAQLDVYGGSAFIWAEAVGASLTALRCPYVITLHSGAFPEFARAMAVQIPATAIRRRSGDLPVAVPARAVLAPTSGHPSHP